MNLDEARRLAAEAPRHQLAPVVDALCDEVERLREDDRGHRGALAAIYLALGTDETDRDKWPARITAMREAIGWWPIANHPMHCVEEWGWCGGCECGAAQANDARSDARRAAGLEP